MRLNCQNLMAPCLIAVITSGCIQDDRPNLAPVIGTVSLDGQPLEHAAVLFRPTEGRASRGVTDADGIFELTYLRDTKGAIVGSHQVSITTRTETRPEERVPDKYNVQTTLTREVKDKQNEFEFVLKSE